jgi:hypothetical protein
MALLEIRLGLENYVTAETHTHRKTDTLLSMCFAKMIST